MSGPSLEIFYRRVCKNARLLLLFSLAVPFSRNMALSQTDNIVIAGKAKEYAGFNLTIKHYTNFISYRSEDIGTFRVDEQGNFRLSTLIDHVTYAFMDLGILRGHIYLEPGKTYDIILPPFTAKKDADRFNPYFRPENVVIGIKNDNAVQLNKDIIRFDEEYDFMFNKNAFRIFNKSDVKLTHRIVAHLDSLFPDNNKFFVSYKRFRYARLYSLSMKRQTNRVIYRFYSNAQVCFNNPAYWQTFDLLFRDFFTEYFTSKKGEELKNAFSDSTTFSRLSLVLGKDSLYAQKEFREAVLLKALYDSFYSGHYDKDKVSYLLGSAIKQGCSKKIRDIARELHDKVNHLRVGSPAPNFTLYNINGKEKSLDSYKGKFVYLNFCNTRNYTCKKDFQLLNAFYNKMRRDLTIISIATDRNTDKLEQFVKSHKYKWDFLYFGDQANVIFDYDIRALPTYILIDPEGNILMAPAPAPEENFATRFYESVKNYRYKKYRKERPKEKSIYEF